MHGQGPGSWGFRWCALICEQDPKGGTHAPRRCIRPRAFEGLRSQPQPRLREAATWCVRKALTLGAPTASSGECHAAPTTRRAPDCPCAKSVRMGRLCRAGDCIPAVLHAPGPVLPPPTRVFQGARRGTVASRGPRRAL